MKKSREKETNFGRRREKERSKTGNNVKSIKDRERTEETKQEAKTDKTGTKESKDKRK